MADTKQTLLESIRKIAGLDEGKVADLAKIKKDPKKIKDAEKKAWAGHKKAQENEEDTLEESVEYSQEVMEACRIAGIPLTESWDDDDEDPDVKIANKDKRQQEFEKKAKKVISKVDADKDMAKLAKKDKEDKDDGSDTADKAPAKKDKPASESKPASGATFASIARGVLKNGGNAAAVRAALEKAGVAVPAHLHSRLHAMKKKVTSESFFIITHPHMPSFYLAENGAMNQYQWISSKDDSTSLDPMVFETKHEAEKVMTYLKEYKNQIAVLTPVKIEG